MVYPVPSSTIRSATGIAPYFVRVKERGIPYLIYSGYPRVEGPCAGALFINKPAAPGQLVAAMEGLIIGDLAC
jgi:hypothetical protein